MVQRTEQPTSPISATQRGCGWLVPRMQLRCGVTCSIRRSGTVPPGAESASPQQKETRKVAQQAPQSRQGDISLIAWQSLVSLLRAILTPTGYRSTSSAGSFFIWLLQQNIM